MKKRIQIRAMQYSWTAPSYFTLVDKSVVGDIDMLFRHLYEPVQKDVYVLEKCISRTIRGE